MASASVADIMAKLTPVEEKLLLVKYIDGNEDSVAQEMLGIPQNQYLIVERNALRKMKRTSVYKQLVAAYLNRR